MLLGASRLTIALPLAGKKHTLRGWMPSTSFDMIGMRSVLRYSTTNAVLRSPMFIEVMPLITCPPPKTFASIVAREAPCFIISLISSSIA